MIRLRFRRDVEGVWSPWIRVPTDDLEKIMEIVNRHFGDLARQLGGPETKAKA